MEEKRISGDYGEVIVYQTADEKTRLDVKFEDERFGFLLTKWWRIE